MDFPIQISARITLLIINTIFNKLINVIIILLLNYSNNMNLKINLVSKFSFSSHSLVMTQYAMTHYLLYYATFRYTIFLIYPDSSKFPGINIKYNNICSTLCICSIYI